VVGVVSYRFGNYEVLPAELPAIESGARAPDPTPLRGNGDAMTVASFNVENLDGHDAERVVAVADVIVDMLGAPDVIALEEVQDDSGPVNDGTVTAAGTWNAVIDAVTFRGGPRYRFREIAPEDGLDGGAPGANIRTGLLFRPDRIAVVDRGHATATDATDVVIGRDGPLLSLSPGRIDPTDTAWDFTRKPLAVEVNFAGRRMFVVVCHFSSRSGSSPLFGAIQPPIIERAEKRRAQAASVRRFVDSILAADPYARVVLLGDFNDYSFSRTIAELNGSLTNLTDYLPEPERYTYIFDGNAQALDHILVSEALAANADVDFVHCCTGVPGAVSDHDPVLARLVVKSSLSHGWIAALPNPFTASTRLTCAGCPTVEIYNVHGALIRRLRLPAAPEARAVAAWDGRDDHGAPVPSGVYFLRATAPEGLRTSKVVRLK